MLDVLEWRGFLVRGTVAQRVAVFIDYQNVYKRAREAFYGERGTNIWHVHGQVRPIAVGLLLRGNAQDRDLVAVHVYRGLPSSRHDEKGYAAAQRQIAAWQNSGDLVTAHHRPLNYRDPRHPREKGIDVQLAIDLVMLVQRDEIDVGIIFSDDTDLDPAIEAVGQLRGPGHAELASWYDPARSGPRTVRSGDRRVYTHILGHAEYQLVCDVQDYGHPAARKPRPPRRR